MADAYARTVVWSRVLSVHQGPRADQRRHGHHRGGQEPHADAGAGRRRRGRRGALELPHRHGRTGRRHAARSRSGCTRHESAVDDVVRAWRTARNSRRTVVLSVPLDVQAQSAEPRPVQPPPAAGADPVREVRHEAVGRPCSNAAARPVFVAGRGAIAHRKVLRDLALRCGALLATSAVAKGALRRRSVRPRHLRRVRHPAGRGVDRRCRPAGGLGLQPHHVDDSARRPDRTGHDRGAGRRRRVGARGEPGRHARSDRRRRRDRARAAPSRRLA